VKPKIKLNHVGLRYRLTQPTNYYDTETNRIIAVGKHDNRLLIIPYEVINDLITPVTIHATTRQQIRFRLTTGRFIIYE